VSEPQRTRRSWAWRYRRLLFLIWLVGFGAVAVAVFLLTRVPLPSEQRLAQTTILTDIHGQPLASLEGGVNRVPVSIDRVPQVVIDAVVATEDRNYFRHGGVDPVGVLRATVADIRGNGNVQGGSTITQQYVKNTYVGHQRTLWRKLKEAALALKVEQKYSKREIRRSLLLRQGHRRARSARGVVSGRFDQSAAAGRRQARPEGGGHPPRPDPAGAAPAAEDLAVAA
jgi:penicillin-binding protein 1A